MLNVAIALWTCTAPPVPMTDGSARLIPVAVTNGRTMDVELGDLDADGHLDLVLATEFGQNAVLFWRGSRYEHDPDALPQGIVRDSEDIAIADLDGDGDLDLVFATEDDQVNELYLNDGAGRFTDVTDRLPVTGVSNSVAAFDADNDGDVDLLFGNRAENDLLLNDGTAHFAVAPNAMPAQRDTTQDIELGDIDGDGDLDVVLANEGANRVLRNNGDGTFADVTAETIGVRASEETREADLADVDGDGDLDLYLANVGWAGHSPQDRLLINDGSGVFTDETDARLPTLPEFSLDADFADLDADGDLDIVLARIAQGLGRPISVLLNDGSGRFSLSNDGVPAASVGHAIDVEIADLDHDGVVDVYVGNHLPRDYVLVGGGAE